MSSAPVQMIEHFSAVSDRYDGIICDVWGVLHNGERVTREAADALAAVRRRGVKVVMLTNAPRMPANVAQYIDQLGGAPEAFDAIIASGGVTRDLIAAKGDRRYHHIGPARDTNIFAGLPARPALLAEADYVVCTGLHDDETETAQTYRPQLDIMLKRGLTMICANPDIVVERGRRLIPCAGAIAELYETFGGRVTWVGKPHQLVYDIARREIERLVGRPVDKKRLIGIGDALRTDVAGAVGYGIDCLFVLDGIHSAELGPLGRDYSPAAVSAFVEKSPLRPTYTTVRLRD
jgi:HAD superfamily hydrolase (TIGR01459 family)